jgi:DNA-binding transcriptional regulator YiaG
VYVLRNKFLTNTTWTLYSRRHRNNVNAMCLYEYFVRIRRCIMKKGKQLLKEIFEEDKELESLYNEGVAQLHKQMSELKVSEQIKEARQKAKLSQAELAKILRTHQQSVSRWESGNFKNFHLSTLYKIANATGKKMKLVIERYKSKS